MVGNLKPNFFNNSNNSTLLLLDFINPIAINANSNFSLNFSKSLSLPIIL